MRHDASLAELAKASIGMHAGRDARLTVAPARAVSRLVDAAGSGEILLEDVLAAHAVLLRDDPVDGPTAGSLRTVQNWVGGSDYSPRGAVHVPPPPELMDDLVAFANRDDLPAVAQAAILRAHFESVHPFPDGNGRVGRALIGAVWRRRGLTPTLIVPVASAMLAEALRRLIDLGILTRLKESVRNGVWAATEVLGEVDDLTRRLRESAGR